MKAPPWLLTDATDLEVGKIVELDPVEVRHLTGPLRRRPGDSIVLADGKGHVTEARIVEIGRRMARAEVLSVATVPVPKDEGVTVGLAVIGGQQMDWAIQKSVEIGVRCVVPLATERVQLRGRDLAGRMDHWRRLSMQALKQCRRAWAMEIPDVIELAEFVEGESERGAGVLAHSDGVAVEDLSLASCRVLVVGPEGGLSDAEEELFKRHDWLRLRLGPHILRAETAVVVGGAMLVARSQKG